MSMPDSARMHEAADSVLPAARSLLSGCRCEYADIRLTGSDGTTISLSGSQVETFSSGSTIAGSVRVLCGGVWGFVSFNDPALIERHFTRALEIASSVATREKTRIRSCPPVRMQVATPAERDFTRVPLEEKFALIGSYNEILRSAKKVQTTRATYRDVRTRYHFLNSEGSEIDYDRAYCGVALSAVARDGAIIQPYHESVSGYGGFELARGRGELAEQVARRAVDLLSAEPVPGGAYRVVADQKLAGVFIHEAFGHLSEADFIHENPRLRAIMQLGRRFGPEGLTVIDSGDMPGLSGYIPVDDEGVPPKGTALITNGALSGRLHSRETAEKMGEEPRGNARAIGALSQPIVRMTNTYIENGSGSREDLLAAAGDGIYAAGYIGGETNLEMFTFTAGCGYEIKNGKLGKMYRDMVLSGNVFSTLGNIAMIGGDRIMFGGLGGCGKGGQSPLPVSFGGPHVLITDVLIGGRHD